MMSHGHRPSIAGPSVIDPVPNILPVPHGESKRDRKRRETINKVEILHDESWKTRDDKFSQLYKEYHNENRAVASQPPTSAQYFLRLYPASLERDALLEAAEIEYQYKKDQARRAYEAEREGIEGAYWDARDQVRARLLGAIEERRRKLREEKEGGDVITEALIEASIKPKPIRRSPFRNRIPQPPKDPLSSSVSSSAAISPSAEVNGNGNGTGNAPPAPAQASTGPSQANGGDVPKTDLMLHSLLAPALSHINIDDILSPSTSTLTVLPPLTTSAAYVPPAKRGPRNKGDAGAGLGGKDGEVVAAPGTATALAIASGQQPAVGGRNGGGRGAGATQGQWVLGKSLAELKKMETASQLEIESDWARIQGTGSRRRTRGD